MQLMIDILAETPAALRLAAKFLMDHAALRDAMDPDAGIVPPNVPTGTKPSEAPPAPLATPATSSIATVANMPIPPPPVVTAPVVPNAGLVAPLADNTMASMPYGVPSVPPPPFVPSAVATTATFPPIPAPTSGVSDAALATAPAVPAAPSTAAVNPAVPGADDYDSSGVPFDARIHQKTRGKKKDGTWKLQKGIDEAVVARVMQELATRIRHPGSTANIPAPPSSPEVLSALPSNVLFGQTPLPAGASPAPVSLPGSVPVPPVPTGIASPAPLPPPVGTPANSIPVPVPPPPAVGSIPTPPPGPVDPFRALVTKITALRKENKITPEEVTQCVTQSGAPSLQLLQSMAHLIGNVEAAIDAIVALR